jgi:hypothetical protein
MVVFETIYPALIGSKRLESAKRNLKGFEWVVGCPLPSPDAVGLPAELSEDPNVF